jgi:cytochrome P450
MSAPGGTGGPKVSDAAFWCRPLADRMADFARLRARNAFIPVTSQNQITGEPEDWFAVTRYAEIMEISRRPTDFCSGRGSISITDLPPDAMEFFGSFIVMDDPRHARQRAIVSRSFTPRQLRGVLDSVEMICSEVIDGMCERGEADFVEALAAPYPLLVICDMMGIPRSEFRTVFDATSVILGTGDPDTLGGRDMTSAILEAGVTLTSLVNELADARRKDPTDDLTSALVHNEVGEDMLAAHEIAPFFILLAVAGHDTTRTATSIGMHLLSQYPEQRRIWQNDPEGVTGSAVEEVVRLASPVTYMRRTVTHPLTLSGREFAEGDKLVMFYGSGNRDPRVFDDPEGFDVRRDPNPHMGFGGPGPHFCLGAHLARRELAVVFRQLFRRLPDIEVVGDPAYFEVIGVPLAGGVKHLPVRFTPQRPVGRG